jgi:shikimate 5-dehydrogenase
MLQPSEVFPTTKKKENQPIYYFHNPRYAPDSIVVCDPVDTKQATEVAAHFKCCAMTPNQLGSLRNVSVVIVGFAKQSGCVEIDDYTLPVAVVQQTPVVVDTRYFPLHTKLEQQAAVYGCGILNGLDFLIHQGIEQLKLWVGVEHWAMVESAAPVIDRAVRHLFYEKHRSLSAT